MKKLLMGSVALFLFSTSIMMFQLSCKKDAKADPAITTTGTPTTVFQEGKVIYFAPNFTGFIISDYDGSNKKNINVTMPNGLYINYHFISISPDHKTLFFDVANSQQSSNITLTFTYSCNIDGTNVKKVDDNSQLHVAY